MTPLSKSVARITSQPFFTYGPDAEKPFVATLTPNPNGDLLSLRPLRSRRESATITIKLADVYRYALQCRANLSRLEKANAVKKKLAERRQARAERRATKAVFQTP